MAKILVVDDEKVLVKGITFNLKNEGYQVETGYDGEEAVELAREGNFDLIILDLMMPKIDGLQACMRIREFSNVPIIMLTARSEDTDKIIGFECGADDYITKPFNILELKARVRALLRRQSEVRSPVLKLDDLVMDTASKTVQRGGKKLLLTSKEYALLEYLLRHQGQTLTRSQISDHVWNFDFDYDSNIVDVYIRYLRNKVDKPFPNKLIHTVRGFGYVMRCGDA